MSNQHEYIPAEHYVEEEQQTGGAPMMEDYNPMEDDGDLPYIPKMPKSSGAYARPLNEQRSVPLQNGFIDVDNIHNYSNSGATQQQPNPAATFQKSLAEMQSTATPSFNTAQQNISKLTQIMGDINNIAGTTDNAGNDVQKYAYSVAIKSINEAIKMLREVDYWIPPTKSEYAPALKGIAQPIIKALTAYVTKVESLK